MLHKFKNIDIVQVPRGHPLTGQWIVHDFKKIKRDVSTSGYPGSPPGELFLIRQPNDNI